MARKKLKPKDKRETAWWNKRNKAREEKQKAHAEKTKDADVVS